MHAKEYIEAIEQLLTQGKDIDVLLGELKRVLSRRGLLKLYPRILRGLIESITRTEVLLTPQVVVARAQDLERQKHGIQEALLHIGGGKSYEVHIDPTIIGGHITTGRGKRIDQSYKSTLLHAYHNLAD
jgi:F0F1-type ATP synthase delta subunit